MQLGGKVVVVTGADRGIGREIGLCCADAGARVVLTGLSPQGLVETKSEITRRSNLAEALCVELDITDRWAVHSMFDKAKASFGVIDAVVANAEAINPMKSILETTVQEWQESINVNLTGTFNITQTAARVLVDQSRGGTIIATGSSAAFKVMPGLIPYIAAKAGIHGMMRLLALELAPHRIRVNTLVPGTKATSRAKAIPGHFDRAGTTLPMREVVSPKELGRYVASAISDADPYMSARR